MFCEFKMNGWVCSRGGKVFFLEYIFWVCVVCVCVCGKEYFCGYVDFFGFDVLYLVVVVRVSCYNE